MSPGRPLRQGVTVVRLSSSAAAADDAPAPSRELHAQPSVALGSVASASVTAPGSGHQLRVEDFVLRVGEGRQGGVPVRTVIAQSAPPRCPVVIWLHATGGDTEAMMPRLRAYARLGFLAVSMDCRYHGARATRTADPRADYQDAVFRAWQQQDESPFLLDNVRDLQHVLDFLETHPRVDRARIGMTGVSLGGMHTWLCAALDPRVAAAAPIIGCQGFRWAIDAQEYHGRVDSLRGAFGQIAAAQGKEAADADVVREAWRRLLPGLLEHYDAPASLPCIAPRPLLIVNGADDRRCPVRGLHPAIDECRAAYVAHGCPERLRVMIQEGVGHTVTPEMDVAVEAFFVQELRPVAPATDG